MTLPCVVTPIASVVSSASWIFEAVGERLLARDLERPPGLRAEVEIALERIGEFGIELGVAAEVADELDADADLQARLVGSAAARR